jgi:hypothetical protein
MKYFLLLLFMIPCISINAGSQATDVSIEAGVVNKDLTVESEYPSSADTSTELLVAPPSDVHVICDDNCVNSEPKQLDNKSVKIIPVQPVVVPIIAPVLTIQKPQVVKHTKNKSKKVMKTKAKLVSEEGCKPAK